MTGSNDIDIRLPTSRRIPIHPWRVAWTIIGGFYSLHAFLQQGVQTRQNVEKCEGYDIPPGTNVARVSSFAASMKDSFQDGPKARDAKIQLLG